MIYLFLILFGIIICLFTTSLTVRWLGREHKIKTIIRELHDKDTNPILIRLQQKDWAHLIDKHLTFSQKNILLSNVNDIIKEGTYLESRPHILGHAIGRLSKLDASYKDDCVEMIRFLSKRHKCAGFISSYLEVADDFPSKKIFYLLQDFDVKEKNNMIGILKKKKDGSRLIALI